jgi:uncharacterized delta-60 repeat protein
MFKYFIFLKKYLTIIDLCSILCEINLTHLFKSTNLESAMKRIATAALAAAIVAALISHPRLSAQPSLQWQQTLSGPGNYEDEPSRVAADPDGNVIVAGFVSVHSYDYGVIKYNPNGGRLWARNYDGPSHYGDDINDLAVDVDGNIYVTGGAYGGSGSDYVTIKYNPQGQQVWMAVYDGAGGHDYGKALALDFHGNVYVTGWSEVSSSNSYRDIVTIKYSPQGQQNWAVRYDGPFHENETGEDLAVDKLGNVYVTGYTLVGPATGTNANYITIKYDARGVQQWIATYDNSFGGEDQAKWLKLDLTGNVYVTGSSGEGVSPLWAKDVLTIKYKNSGQQLWTARFDGQAYDSFESPSALALDQPGNLLISTGTTNGINYGTFIVLKYDNDGFLQWADYGNPEQRLYDLVVDEESNVYLTGSYYLTNDNFDCITLKYDPNGNILWWTRFGLVNKVEIGRCIALDQDDNILIGGTTAAIATINFFEDFLTLKYSHNEMVVGSPMPVATISCSPNPFNLSTVASYELRVASHVSLKIYDIAGRLVQTLANGWQEAGEHEVMFDGTGLPSGIYLYRLETEGQAETGKMLLLK